MSERLLPPRFLFRFSAPCRYQDPLWKPDGVTWRDTHLLPRFESLDGAPGFADVHAGWSEAGLAFHVRLGGKRRPVRCDVGNPTDSDRFEVWIDTRDTHNIHRASRFCHQFVFLPSGGGPRRSDPHAEQLLIGRAREDARMAARGQFQVRSEKRVDGYLLEVLIAAGALTGFDPVEHPRLGFTYAVCDHELGEQTFSCSSDFPFHQDPSLWGTLELVR